MFNYDHIIKVLNGSIGALTVFRLQRKAVFLLMFLLLFSFTATGSAAPSLNNGGFETPDVSGWEAQPSGSGWSAENNGFKIADSGSAYGNTAYAGSQNAILQGAVWISQSVSGFEVGKKYTVSWAEADRATPYGQNNFNVSLGGTVVATAHIAASTSWEVKTSSEFTATSTTHTLQFEAFNTGGGDKSVFIDSISIEVIESNEPPGKASNPSPADDATSVGLDSDLSWTGGDDSNSSDVYFGTDSTPDSGEFEGNQSGTSFDPGSLDPNTTYYWRIDEINAYGTTTGDVWSFTTTGNDLGWYAPDTGADFSYTSGESANWTFTDYSPFDPVIANDTVFDSTEVKYVAFWTKMTNAPSSVYFCGFSFLDGVGTYVKTPDVAETVTGDWQMVKIDLSDKQSGTGTYTGDRTFRIDLQQSSYSALSSATIEIDWISLTNSNTWDGYTRDSTDLVWDFSSTPDVAKNPVPDDQETDVSLDIVLKWWPGKDANSRDVYFGTDSTPDSGEFQGNQTALSFDPGTLDPSTTYYWRIDEKTATSTTTGDVWSFTTTGDDLGWYAPEDTGADFSYSSGESANWTFTNYSPFDPQIENDTEFDSSEVKYVAFWARMSNTPSSLYFCGFSFGSGGYVKTPDVAETVTGDWQMVRIDLSDKYSGTDTYTGDRTFRIDLQQSSYSALSSATIEIDWISLTNSSTWDGYTRNSTDLVWDFSSTPDAASHPYPEDEAVYVENDEVLEWWPGKDATSRDVYFGTDPTPDSSEFQGNQSATSFDPNTLDYDTTYYWRVDEKTASSTTTGDVWRFTTEPIPPNNPVLNPGFESPDVSGYEYRPSGSNWSGVNGFVIADDGSAFNNTAYEGNQNACLQNVSSCSQAVSGLEVGKSYTVSWVEASRPSAGGNNFRVLIDGSVVASLHTVTDTDWVEKTSESFVATSTTQTLKFDALGGAGGDRTVFLDSISIDRCYDCGIGWSITFPGSTWDSMSPASLGLNQTKLDQFANNIGGQGIIVRQGYVVKTWGTTSYKSDWASAAKPVISTMLFFAIEEDKLDDVDELIEDHGWNLISKDETMTFRHLANMVSGYARGEVPGARWAYNDYAIQLYAETLFDNVYETSANAAATNSNRLGALDFQDGSIFSSRDGYGLSTSVRDAARIGWLWCNYGYWDGEQLLPRSYFENYMKAQVSSSTPRTSSGGSDYLGVGTFGGGSDQTGDGPGVYGFNWWCNPNQSNWPDAPADTVQANGHWGMEVITVIPSLSLVVAYKGGNTRGHSTGSSSSAMNQDLKLLTEACPEFPVGSIMVDPTESSRMVYHATYENGHLKPVCFAGPGDPEDFFYNDTQDNLDLLTSRGARCTYITAVLKDFGGGNPGTGSALDSKLTEWEGYITDLEDAGVITVFFFFDDDQARTSNWQELVDKCVAKFKHHKLLIWSVAEEYAEAMTSSQVAEVAARIKDKDEYNHVVGVHQNHGNSFNFASNPNLDMFLMQLNETSASALHSGVKNSNVNGNKILNMAEAEDHAKKDRTTVRKWNWACIMGGASAVQVIWMGRDSDPSDWNTVDKYNDCARLTEFMESTRVNDTVCNDSLAYGNTDYVLADAGNAYILYGDSGTSLGGNISAGTYSVTWFDCIDGDLVENGNSALSSGNQNFTKPGSIGNEAVCYLERQ